MEICYTTRISKLSSPTTCLSLNSPTSGIFAEFGGDGGIIVANRDDVGWQFFDDVFRFVVGITIPGSQVGDGGSGFYHLHSCVLGTVKIKGCKSNSYTVEQSRIIVSVTETMLKLLLSHYLFTTERLILRRLDCCRSKTSRWSGVNDSSLSAIASPKLVANGRFEILGRDFSPPTESDTIRFCPICLPDELPDDDFAADEFADDDLAADDWPADDWPADVFRADVWPADDLAELLVDAVEGSAAPTFGDCVRFFVLYKTNGIII